MESCPGQLCAKNVNNSAAAALHIKSLTLRYFIQLGLFLSFFSFYASSTSRVERFFLRLQSAAVSTNSMKRSVQRGTFVVFKNH